MWTRVNLRCTVQWGHHPLRTVCDQAEAWHSDSGRNKRETPHLWTHCALDHKHWPTQQWKTKKYTQFLTDITNYTCTLNCIEVSSTGYINARNKSTLTTLHSFLRKDMKKSVFLSNLNSLAWYGSYQLWLTREGVCLPSLPHQAPASSGFSTSSRVG